MTPKIKNILIFGGVGLVMVLVYIFFIKKGPEEPALTTESTTPGATTSTFNSDTNASLARDFLAILLNVKSLKLDDTVLTDQAYLTLRDSSIVLVPDGTEGRPNPFAPIGAEDNVPLGVPVQSTQVAPPTPTPGTTPVTPTGKTPTGGGKKNN